MTVTLTGPGAAIAEAEGAESLGGNGIEFLKPGIQTTVQDLAGRSGFWDVGVPPSGAFDDHSFALAGLAVGNTRGEAGLECVMVGPVLAFTVDTVIAVAGAATTARLDGVRVVPGVPTPVAAGAVLDMGKLAGPGMRGYLAVSGGIDVREVLGSRSTFVLGKFGGLDGRALRRGDVLPLGRSRNPVHDVSAALPVLTSSWELRVMLGPHGAPVHLTPDGADELFAASWAVDHRSDRTGVRLVGPTPGWARTDGGEAGLHPSNVHDSAYPVGGIMLSGDTPVIVGPDGPSLGGFVVPCVVIGADRWILGQLRPGDAVRLVPVSLEQARAAQATRRSTLAALVAPTSTVAPPSAVAPTPAWINIAGVDQHRRIGTQGSEVNKFGPADEVDPRGTPGDVDPRGTPGDVDPRGTGDDVDPGSTRVAVDAPETRLTAPLAALAPTGHRPDFTVRLAGDRHVLVEAGRVEFDLTVRMWIHLLADALRAHRPAGVTEIVEGVRSLLVAVDDSRLRPTALAAHLADLAAGVADPTEVTLNVREVTLPIAFDHPQAHEAMQRYQKSVNPTAPWCPDNVEFIRRMNDLPQRDDVFGIVEAATYLVVGLGDVYLGAPVAVPIDPRHRLVTTKYNPARTWTPQNAVGIGGIYLCVYGMEGPGGYQLVGRTVPVWRLLTDDPERDPQPWLLRQFDRLRFTPVTTEELEDTRADILAGRSDLRTRAAQFSLSEVAGIEAQHAAEIAATRATRQAAFQAERARWNA
ncbi:biotin-dependent carboxylase uncharacterized domain-containing protein [Nakamurella panacisegetis]|uniref:Biotin-dependent carboxylase uncharacterized domain-containing protein n=1 Tax=Nakamurella panacisegetis TaxID=1090615 RepID=A0A1H0MUE4_9ACTN|nr:5-oxoprolinase/urea amidolyase family protein [Nakamurella panacisegetis]SDO84088.1 biotin-dependent carboxylase uncharacterized domain-containing protein [Nakamurella panacisegetis]